VFGGKGEYYSRQGQPINAKQLSELFMEIALSSELVKIIEYKLISGGCRNAMDTQPMEKTKKRKMYFLFRTNLIIIILLTGMLCACQNSDSSPAHSAIKAISGVEQLKTIIQSSDNGLIMIDFYANWCGPCRKLAPRLEKIALENGEKVTIYKLDIDKHKEISSQYGVRSIPFVAFFRNKKMVHQLSGLQPANEYLKIIKQFS